MNGGKASARPDRHGRLAAVGIALTVFAVIVPFLGVVAIVVGIVLVVRSRIAVGVLTLVGGGLVAPVVGAALWNALVVKTYRIPSETMSPTLAVGDRIGVDRLGLSGSPEVGDIVVFTPPAGAESGECGKPVREGRMCTRPTAAQLDGITFVKRIVAGPGDRVALRDGRVVLNGKPRDEPYIRGCDAGGECDFPRETTVPAGHYFMLGDNRGASDDSRYWGPVREGAIVGVAVFRYWPPGRTGGL